MSAEDGFTSLSETRLAIIGLGLMGGSLALALRGHCQELLGIDTNTDTLSLARRRDIADHLDTTPLYLLPQANLIILATPVKAILSLLKELPNLHSGQAVILDLGSTKGDIMQAMAELPKRFDPVGGHPMCGKEKSGLAEADPQIYQGVPFALTRLPRTSSRACALVEELVTTCGAYPLWLDASEHDRWVAATSHLPYLLANALAGVTPLEAASLAGPGFRSTSRVAETDPQLMLDILQTNQGNIITALRGLQDRLHQIETYLKREEWNRLLQILREGASRRQTLLAATKRGERCD